MTGQPTKGQPPDGGKKLERRLEHSTHKCPSSPSLRELDITDIDGEHQRLLVRAITRILSTDLAEFTFAQILDGLPTGEVAYDSRSMPYEPYGGHPIDTVHDKLCPGILGKIRELLNQFQLKNLKFNPQVCSVPSPFERCVCNQRLP